VEWFRVYDTIIDDPKILQLSPEFRWFFVGILAISSRQKERGTLPKPEEIGLHLRIQRRRVESLIATFVDLGFIDVGRDGKSLSVHGWSNRQFKSDDITARTKASKERSRERSKGGTSERAGNVPRVRATDSDTESDKDVVRLPSGGDTSHASAREAGPTRPATFKAPAVIDAETEARLTAEAAAKKARWDAAEAARRAKREANGQP
jgi:hypothetical protein